MSEGRTPTATLTQQRRLEQDDVDILHQIVIRAQNDSLSQENPKDALLQAYGEIFNERKLGQNHDKACFNVLLKLLNPSTPGASLYHKFESILQEEGIVLAYEDDDITTQEEQGNTAKHSDHVSDLVRSRSDVSEQASRQNYDYDPIENDDNQEEIENDVYFERPPLYVSQLLRQAQARDRSVLAKQTIDAWRRALETVQEQQLEARADALYHLRLKRKVLKQCLAVFQDLHQSQLQADHIYKCRLARNVLGKTSDEYRVRRVSSIDEDRTKGLSLYKWVVASREINFTRARELRTKHDFLRRLISSYRAGLAKGAYLEELLVRKEGQGRKSMLRAVMGFLTERTQDVKESEVRAETRNEMTLYHASINSWRLRMGKLNDLVLTAEDAREYFLMKRVLRRLKSTTVFRRDRRIWLATWASGKWRQFVKVRKHERYDEAYRQMRRTLKMNLAHKFLLRWKQKLVSLETDDSRADAMYKNNLMRRLVRPVIEFTYDTAEWVKTAQPIADEKSQQFLKQRAMIAIQMKQQSLVDMEVKAERLRQYRIEQRAVHGLRQMQLRAFELQRRQFDADAFRTRLDKRAVRSALARLRRILAERRVGNEGLLTLMPVSAITPARKKEELLLHGSTRLSTTPAYTPFSVRLRQEPRILEDIDDEEEEEEELDNTQQDIVNVSTDS